MPVCVVFWGEVGQEMRMLHAALRLQQLRVGRSFCSSRQAIKILEVHTEVYTRVTRGAEFLKLPCG